MESRGKQGIVLILILLFDVDFRKSKGSDIIQSLVSIYDTKDVFIKELQVRLAQQLLAIRDYSLQREVSYTSVHYPLIHFL